MSLEAINKDDYGYTVELTYKDTDTDTAADISGYTTAQWLILKSPSDVASTVTASFKTDGSDGRPLYAAIDPTAMNAAGTVSVALSGQTLNLPFIVEPELTSTVAVVGVRDAFRTFRSAVNTLAADVVSTLGRDIAVYQEVAMGATDANGLASIDGTA